MFLRRISSTALFAARSSTGGSLRVKSDKNNNMSRLFASVADADARTQQHQSPLLISTNNEHVAAEKVLLRALHRSDGDKNRLRVLAVVGGGDNCLSLAADPRVASVKAVDLNPHQLALSQLKLAVATSDLSQEEALNFLGAGDGSQIMQAQERREIFDKVLAHRLPQEVLQLIQDKLSVEVAGGVCQFGGSENVHRHIRDVLASRGISPASLWDGSANLEELERACCEGRLADADTFLQALGLDRFVPPQVYQHMKSVLDVDSNAKRVTSGFHRLVRDGSRSFCAASALRGAYSADSLPDWLTEKGRAALRDKKDILQFECGNVLEMDADPSFDLVTPSNLFDWSPSQQSAVTLTTVADKFLADKGLFLFRRAFGGIEEVLGFVDGYSSIDVGDLSIADESPFFYKSDDALAAIARV